MIDKIKNDKYKYTNRIPNPKFKRFEYCNLEFTYDLFFIIIQYLGKGKH